MSPCALHNSSQRSWSTCSYSYLGIRKYTQDNFSRRPCIFSSIVMPKVNSEITSYVLQVIASFTISIGPRTAHHFRAVKPLHPEHRFAMQLAGFRNSVFVKAGMAHDYSERRFSSSWYISLKVRAFNTIVSSMPWMDVCMKSVSGLTNSDQTSTILPDLTVAIPIWQMLDRL